MTNAQKLLSARISGHLLRTTKRPLTKWLFGKTWRELSPAELRIYETIRSKIWEYNNPGVQRWKKQRQRFYSLGLTSRGTPQKYRILGQPKTPQEIRWREFRATLDIQTPQFLNPLER